MTLKAALMRVFSRPWYLALAAGTAAVVFAFSVLLPNISLVAKVATDSGIPLSQKVRVVGSLFGSIGTNFTAVSATYTFAIALLLGVNLSLFTFYLRDNRAPHSAAKSASWSVGGLASGLFGIGCAACGTFVLSTLLGVAGAVAVLTHLPFGGAEFGFLGVGLLLYSSFALGKKIAHSTRTCET